ncbi:MAG: ABC transporter permease [Bryobacterales bacterium]|nr:ABC transporter permease [Bryobacterales bacterium]MBV9401439.1 ABC transporter permease [Bryobacterales bacterium]
MNTATFVEGTFQDLRNAARMLRLNPAFSITAILTLALGIGATTAMFSVVNGVVIKPLPYPDSDALVTVTHSAVFGNVRGRDFPFSPQMLAVYLANNQTFQQFGMWRPDFAAITGLGDPERAIAFLVTQGFLPALGVQPALGRWFSPADDQPGAPETMILSDGYWHRRFGGDPRVIGRIITVDSRLRQVIGVMPARFIIPIPGLAPDLILPLQINLAQPPGDFNYRALARLKPGVTAPQANADVGRMLPIYLGRYAGHRMDALHLLPAVRAFKEDVVGDVGQVLWVLLGSISILLLIACANVANLLLVRAQDRGQELAVRAALGASWGHIARSLIVESLMLSLLGALISVGLTYGGLQVLVARGPAYLPRLTEITIDSSVLAFTLAISVVSGLLFGLIPIVKVMGPKSAWTLAGFVRGGGRWASGGKSQHRSQDALVVVQVALALVLLVSSGLMIRTFQNLRRVDPGFAHPEEIQTVRPVMPPGLIAHPDRLVRTEAQILERLAAIPGVTSAAYTNSLPMDRGIAVIVYPESKTYAAGELPPTRTVKMISPGLFRTLQTRVIAGRDVDWAELYNERNVVLVSESFARETWDTVAGAIGKRIKLGTTGSWQEVIGVVGDIRDNGADQKAPPIVYCPAREQQMIGPVSPVSVAFTLRSNRTGTEGFLSDIRKAVAAVDPNLPLASINTVAALYEISMERTSFSLVLLGIAGGLALLLGIVGIYGVLAYAVMQRQREVGIRLALGAQPGTVKGMFVYRGMILSGIGIALGMAVAAGLTRLMSSLLFGVRPVDAATFAAAAGVLVVAALAASYIPARRAAAVDPVDTLRGQ